MTLYLRVEEKILGEGVGGRLGRRVFAIFLLLAIDLVGGETVLKARTESSQCLVCRDSVPVKVGQL